jgi:type I restriction enzyme, S subunit
MPGRKGKSAWMKVAFGDVARLCRERSADPVEDGFVRYVGLEHLEPGDLKLRRWGNTEDGTTFTSVFRAGQVLFGKRRAYQRKVALADFEGVCSGDIYVLETNDPKTLLPELLPFICQTDRFFEHAVGTSAGSLSPRTNWESLVAYEFALPPLDEQRRIAEVLGAAASCGDAARIFRERLYGVECAVLADAVVHRPSVRLVPVADLLTEPPRNGISPNVNSDGRGLRTVSISSVADGLFDPEGCVKHVEIDPATARPYLEPVPLRLTC